MNYSCALFHRTCSECVAVIRNAELCRIAMSYANSFDHRVKLAYALLEQFNEEWLDKEIQKEAQQFLSRSSKNASPVHQT